MFLFLLCWEMRCMEVYNCTNVGPDIGMNAQRSSYLIGIGFLIRIILIESLLLKRGKVEWYRSKVTTLGFSDQNPMFPGKRSLVLLCSCSCYFFTIQLSPGVTIIPSYPLYFPRELSRSDYSFHMDSQFDSPYLKWSFFHIPCILFDHLIGMKLQVVPRPSSFLVNPGW